MTMPAETQPLALFDVDDVLPASTAAPQDGDAGWNYAHHLFQRTGPAMWKLGQTEVSPLVRARQIACVPVAWWPGTLQDERRMQRLWKHHRVSPAAEFFWQDGDQLDRFILRKITQEMPSTLIAMQLEVFAGIELRWYEEQGPGLSTGLLMDLLTALSGQKRTQVGETARQALEQIFYGQLRARKRPPDAA